MPRLLNPFKRKRAPSNKVRKYLRKISFRVSADKPHCWVAYCEYGKVNITQSDRMLRMTVCKKGGKAVQHLTCKYDKNNNFRVYYSNLKGVVDVTYRYPYQQISFVSQMFNSITNAKKNIKACRIVEGEYNKRFNEVFWGLRPEDYGTGIVHTTDTWKLIYPLNSDKEGFYGRPPTCFIRSIRSREPKEFVRKFFGKAPKSLVKAVTAHIPFTKRSVSTLFVARSLYSLWPLDNVVEFLNVSKEEGVSEFLSKVYEREEMTKLPVWQNFFKHFSHRKIMNWVVKYPSRFGEYMLDTLHQLEELKKYGVKIKFSRKMDLKQVHDLVGKLYNKLDKKTSALPVYNTLYGLKDKQICGYDVHFPRTSQDLNDWGSELTICVGSYSRKVVTGESTIFSLHKDGKPEYCVEYALSPRGKHFDLLQSRGKYNRDTPENIKKAIARQVKKTVESAFNSDKIKKTELIFPKGHEIKAVDITKDIDLEALENIQQLQIA